MPDPIPRGPFDEGLFLTQLNKGREAFEARKFEEAERQLEEAYLLRPRDLRVLNLLGLVYFRGDKLAKAEEVYRKLITQSPDVATLHQNLGLVCYKLGRLDDAEQAFRKALELSQGNPKIHFYLGSIYERMQRYKDAIFQYRQAGANLMVQRLEGRLDHPGSPAVGTTTLPPTSALSVPMPPAHAPASAEETLPPRRMGPTTGAVAALVAAAAAAAAAPPTPPPRESDEPDPLLLAAGKQLRPVSPTLLTPDTGEPAEKKPANEAEPLSLPPLTPAEAGRDVFRVLERGLLEVDFSGKVYIRQGTIYSYTGNLTFWVKDRRPGGQVSLAIVTGTGRLILSSGDREISFLPVGGEPVFVSPDRLLACEEGLSPRFVRIGEPSPVELVALDGAGTAALAVASRPLPLAVRPGVPVCVPAASLIAWTGALHAEVVQDPQVYEVVLPSTQGGARLLRLEGNGRVLLEQAAV
ncbi:MAG TPA: tetratricopeptide repeat protein [Vicinamibacteria bacterium]|nr:tetratricopeptide repeat protein [Vicinamibacteria bacterium]